MSGKVSVSVSAESEEGFDKNKLRNAVFEPLQEADLIDIRVIGEENLTIEQLSKVKSLYKAKLDPELMEQVKKHCPHLLEKPKKGIMSKQEISETIEELKQLKKELKKMTESKINQKDQTAEE